MGPQRCSRWRKALATLRGIWLVMRSTSASLAPTSASTSTSASTDLSTAASVGLVEASEVVEVDPWQVRCGVRIGTADAVRHGRSRSAAGNRSAVAIVAIALSRLRRRRRELIGQIAIVLEQVGEDFAAGSWSAAARIAATVSVRCVGRMRVACWRATQSASSRSSTCKRAGIGVAEDREAFDGVGLQFFGKRGQHLCGPGGGQVREHHGDGLGVFAGQVRHERFDAGVFEEFERPRGGTGVERGRRCWPVAACARRSSSTPRRGSFGGHGPAAAKLGRDVGPFVVFDRRRAPGSPAAPALASAGESCASRPAAVSASRLRIRIAALRRLVVDVGHSIRFTTVR